MYTYKNTGVNIKKADEIIRNISSKFNLDNLKNFAGIYCNNELFKGYNLISCTDGIGSKIIPLIEKNDPYTIASDLCAMNLNDLATLGAKALFFLDYIAVNKLEGDIVQKTIENLKIILSKYNCALLGGEISELPDLIKEKYFDIAGFLVGYYKKEDFLDKNNTKKGDIILALPSSGIHSNGFSLIRKLYRDKKISKELFNSTLKPTKIYYDTALKINAKKLAKSMANITGGGIFNNLKRAIKDDLELSLDMSSIKKQEIFEVIKKFVDINECYKVFNMGVGFCIIADKNNADLIQKIVPEAFILGELK